MVRIRNSKRTNIAISNSNDDKNNSYEETRRKRLQENLNRFQELGITNISKNLTEALSHEKKSEIRNVKNKLKVGQRNMGLRRSSRHRGVVPSYQEVDIDLREYPKSYAGRKRARRIASSEESIHAVEAAEELQSNLTSGHPSFVKSMVRSHVSSCFWLGLPATFCKSHLPPNDIKMILEDQNGTEYDTIYIGSRTGLSGGWKAFAMAHELDEGDALVFELIEPERFKVYIVKASDFLHQDGENKS